MLSTRWRPQPTAGSDAVSAWHLLVPEWELIVAGRAHVLIEGEKSRVRQTIVALASQVPRSVTTWKAGANWPSSPHTFVVEDVDGLSDGDQNELLARLDGLPSPVQIVSTSGGSLYGAVQRGRFRDDLYYRLNMLRLDLTSRFATLDSAM